jgi:ankyrin repeat protein
MSDRNLDDAIRVRDLVRVRELVTAEPGLLAGRDERGLSPVLAAKYVGADEIADALVSAGAPLDVFDAAATGGTARLNELLAADPSLVSARSPDGFTALHYAAYFADGPTVAALLVAGADPAAVADNATRVQPLHSAAASRNLEGARLLLGAGADPNAEQQDGFLPLDAALQNGDDALQELLREHGARSSR